MAPKRKQKLKKELGLFDVYAIATGVTLSAGFFLLPGLAAVEAGSGLPLAYLLAGLIIIPGLASMAELATAMPRAGGVYYFLDRSMGPLMGTIGGFGTWIALSLKSAFALIGIGAYLRLFLPDVNIVPISAGFAIVFGLLNILGAKKSTSLQSVMVVGLLTLLAWFTGVGLTDIEPANLSGMFGQAPGTLVSTAGLVVVSYMGLTQVASVAEEVRNPERNIPLGMFLAFGTAMLVYTVGTAVMVGVVSADVLARDGGDLTPVATVADVLVGRWGTIVMTTAAVLAFSSVANAGILSASRYPLAMSRDNVLPRFFSKFQAQGAPLYAIYATVCLILVFVVLFDASRIAKLAGAFQLTMFALSCLALIVMRESRIESYDPRFRSPFYPWLHILGVLAPFWLIVQMGLLASLFTGGLITFGAMWYSYYARERVDREGAIYHVFERLGRNRDAGLDRELREIMKEKGLRDADPFEEVVTAASIIDTPRGTGFRDVIWEASAHLADASGIPVKELGEDFLQGTVVGMTPVSHGVALPHLRRTDIESAQMVLVRCPGGMEMDVEIDKGRDHESEPVQAVFFLMSPLNDPGRHLRLLAQIAGRVDKKDFMDAWLSASNHQELKEAILRDDRLLALTLKPGTPSESLIGRALKDIPLPEGTLIALVRRGPEMVIPRGATVLERGDRLTIIGEPADLRSLGETFRAASDVARGPLS
jgi:amino acid transporter/mannitol/fructose-specific phosphotransferase system IIA component (Ntr-type)